MRNSFFLSVHKQNYVNYFHCSFFNFWMEPHNSFQFLYQANLTISLLQIHIYNTTESPNNPNQKLKTSDQVTAIKRINYYHLLHYWKGQLEIRTFLHIVSTAVTLFMYNMPAVLAKTTSSNKTVLSQRGSLQKSSLAQFWLTAGTKILQLDCKRGSQSLSVLQVKFNSNHVL